MSPEEQTTDGAPANAPEGTTAQPQAESAPSAQVDEAPAGGEMVQVPKSLLDDVLKGQRKLEEGLAARDKEIERLTYAADKSRLGIYDARNGQGQLIRKMRVGMWALTDPESGEVVSRHIIRGWKMIQDDVFVEDNGGVRRVVEKQVIRLFLDNGADETGKDKPFIEVDVDYLKFYSKVERVEGEVVKENRDNETGAESRVLRFPDGRTVDIDIRFVNI